MTFVADPPAPPGWSRLDDLAALASGIRRVRGRRPQRMARLGAAALDELAEPFDRWQLKLACVPSTCGWRTWPSAPVRSDYRDLDDDGPGPLPPRVGDEPVSHSDARPSRRSSAWPSSWPTPIPARDPRPTDAGRRWATDRDGKRRRRDRRRSSRSRSTGPWGVLDTARSGGRHRHRGQWRRRRCRSSPGGGGRAFGARHRGRLRLARSGDADRRADRLQAHVPGARAECERRPLHRHPGRRDARRRDDGQLDDVDRRPAVRPRALGAGSRAGRLRRRRDRRRLRPHPGGSAGRDGRDDRGQGPTAHRGLPCPRLRGRAQ